MGELPERIWLLPFDGEQVAWCDQPDPSGQGHEADATEYLRADISAAREAALRAEVERLTQERDEARSRFNDIDLCRMASAPCDTLLRSYAERDRLRGLLDEAVAGLEPFGTYLATHPFDLDNHGNPVSDDQGCGWVYLTAGQFRRARATLAKIGGQHD